MIFDGLSDDQVAQMAQADFQAARTTRAEIEARKLVSYQMYRAWRKELTAGGKGEGTDGPFGWSRLTDPILFTIIETILPRVGIDPPGITVTADNPQAVPFQQAKQMRINRHMKMAGTRMDMLLSIKQFLLYGDGPIKTRWDADLGGPSFVAIDWFDWFVSSDAMQWHSGEVLGHRTWHTPRGVKLLIERDQNRRDPRTGEKMKPLYDAENLERIAFGAGDRTGDDDTYEARREASGLGSVSHSDEGGSIGLVEMHYVTGEMALIPSDGTPLPIRVVREPQFLDPKGRPFRPFAVLQNTPDLFQPYGISDAEMVEDHQHESSTIKNQAIDQATRNINSPKGYNRQRVDASEVQAAWSQPGGLFPTDGPPGEAVFLYPPGNLSGDVERMTEAIRRNAQEIVGVNDVVQGLAATSDQTATEVTSLREEANQRFRFKLVLIQIGFTPVAQHFDWMDRRIGASSISVPVEEGEQLDPTARGFTPIAGGKFVRVDTAANAAGNEFSIELDVGAMAPPAAGQQAQKTRALITDLSHPAIQGMVNWPELANSLVETHGLDPKRILLDPTMAPGAGMPPGVAGAAGPGGPPVQEAPPIEEPVGPPIPVEAPVAA